MLCLMCSVQGTLATKPRLRRQNRNIIIISPGLWQFGLGSPPRPPCVVLQEELESVQKRAGRFVTGNYNYETGSMTGILGQLKRESLKKRGKDNRRYIKVLKVKPVYQQMTLSQARYFPNLNGASLHRAFHVHPSIVSK